MLDVNRADPRRGRLSMHNGNVLKVGVFGANCSYGVNISHAPTTYKVTWEHTSQIVKRAGDASCWRNRARIERRGLARMG